MSDLTGNDILVRYPGDGNDLPGESTTITDVASFIQKVTIEKDKDTSGADGNGNSGNSNNLTGSKLALLNGKDNMSYISVRTATQAAPNADITRAEVATIYTTKINSFSDVFCVVRHSGFIAGEYRRN